MKSTNTDNLANKSFPCPECKQPSLLSSANLHRPFCSERCKLIDLGDWAAEEHKIAGESVGQHNLAAFEE